MKKLSLLLVAVCCLFACSNEESNLTINGRVQGLKKGTLYLQKIEDTSLVTLDSVVVDGTPNFSFKTHIESPQVLYLFLNKVDGTDLDDRVLFFAEPGEMTVNTTLENFEGDVVVEGSRNQEKLMEYRKMMQRFNTKNLEIIKANLEAQQSRDEEKLQATANDYNSLLRRRYLATVNFAINNKDMEVAPYLAISEVFDANIKYLDTIYKSLTPEVRDSRYGQSLEAFLEERREMDKINNDVEVTASEDNI